MDRDKAVTLIVIALLCVFVADFCMAKGYYANFHDMRGWKVVKRWSEKRAKYLCWSGALCLVLVVALLCKLFR